MSEDQLSVSTRGCLRWGGGSAGYDEFRRLGVDFGNLDRSPVYPSVAGLGSVLLALVPALVAGGGGMEGSGGVKVQENKGEYSPVVFVYILLGGGEGGSDGLILAFGPVPGRVGCRKRRPSRSVVECLCTCVR